MTYLSEYTPVQDKAWISNWKLFLSSQSKGYFSRNSAVPSNWSKMKTCTKKVTISRDRLDEYRVSSIKHRVSSIEYQVSSIKYQLSSIKYRVSSIEYQVSSRSIIYYIQFNIFKVKSCKIVTVFVLFCSVARSIF